jgi:hypothetical protein
MILVAMNTCCSGFEAFRSEMTGQELFQVHGLSILLRRWELKDA